MQNFYNFLKKLIFIIHFIMLSSFSIFAQTDEKNNLIFLTWQDYIDPDVVKAYEQKFNVTVKQVFYETEYAKDKLLTITAGKGYDLMISSRTDIKQYIKRGWIEPFKKENIPNLKHIVPKMLSADEKIIDYAVPYLWGTIGIAYRKDIIKEELKSWKDIFEPKENLRNKIIMIKDCRELVGCALKYLGYSVNSIDQDELSKASNLLLNQKNFVKKYGYVKLGKESEIIKGDYYMAMIYNGDALSLQKIDPNIAFFIPKEGTALWMDYLVIMQSSTKKELAAAFINFLNEPENASKIAQYLNFASPNQSAYKYLSKEHLSDPSISPAKEVLDKCEFSYELPARIMKNYNNIFFQVVKE